MITRKIAYLVNFIFLFFFVAMCFDEVNERRGEPLKFAILALLPVINLIALVSLGKGEDFLSLYFQKKRLEQKKRIMELQNEIDKGTDKTG